MAVHRYLTAFGPTVDGRSVLPFDVRRMTTAPPDLTGFGRFDLLLAIVDDDSTYTAYTTTFHRAAVLRVK